ncbi:MAG: hypothetical protein NC038_05510 [Paludibacter sp.]|nr:hypothetical protein [Bacteroidales bacterium]MCM1069828.1 hypothetical protein [Prevotella sp.]MCM1353978.1 hypothetical protein [Bacteroides sp.]MCM1443380.1 hypothetical protein [Muribaculum sp.]MCM1482083.1 hypothetical protein [Paludibacter sp.]
MLKDLLIILLVLASPFILLVIIADLSAVYLIITGKHKSPEIQAKIAEKKKRDAEKKERKMEQEIQKAAKNPSGGFRYPSPLNRYVR